MSNLTEIKRERALHDRLEAENSDLRLTLSDARGLIVKADQVLERCGYRHCDIPACNCGGYHKVKCTLEENINRAAGELPEGWMIEIAIEPGAGWVNLTTPDGNAVDVSGAGTINEQVSEAISYAGEHDTL